MISLSNHAQAVYNAQQVPAGGYPIGTKANFSCDPGYSNAASAQASCRSPGSWSTSGPYCLEGNL